MRTSLLALVLFASLACTRSSTPPAPPPADPDAFALPLAARLDREAHRRPPGTPTAEEVLAALVRAGLPLERTQQVLASTVGAAYCSSAVTEKGVAVAVCEYPAEDAARRGLEYSHRAFDRLIPGRRLLLNRSTMLTVTGANDAEAKQAANVFAAL
jgi:hypothetical protein